MTKRADRNNWWTVIAGLLGCLIGPVILLPWSDPPDLKYAEFNRTPEFWVWVTLLGFQTSLWSVLALTIWRELRPLKPFQTKNLLQLLLLILSSVLTTLFIVFLRPGVRPLRWHEPRMGILQAMGVTVALLALHGIWLIYKELDGVRRQMLRERHDGKSIRSLLALRAKLEKFLFAAGTIIGGATLATGALRRALIAIGEGKSLPAEYVLLYGVIYSLFIGLIYWPVHLKFQSVGGKLRNRLVPLHKTETESWAQWSGNRKALDDLLQLQANPLANLYGSVSILAPLVGSMVGLLLGGKS